MAAAECRSSPKIHLGIIPDGNRRWCKRQGATAGALVERHIKNLVRTMTLSVDLFAEHPDLADVRKLSMYMLSIDNLNKRTSATDGTLTMVSGMLEGIHWLAVLVYAARAFAFPGLSPPRANPATLEKKKIRIRLDDDDDFAGGQGGGRKSTRMRRVIQGARRIVVTIDVEGVRPLVGPLFPHRPDAGQQDAATVEGLNELRVIAEHLTTACRLRVRVSRPLMAALTPCNRRIVRTIADACNRRRAVDGQDDRDAVHVYLCAANGKDNNGTSGVEEAEEADVVISCTDDELVRKVRHAAALMSRWSRLRVAFVGQKHMLPLRAQQLWTNIERITSCHGDDEPSLDVRFALAYDPMADMRRLLDRPEEIDSIDVVVRTSGERRSSGFFPVETLYSEWVYVDGLFPDITVLDVAAVLREYRRRDRRMGA